MNFSQNREHEAELHYRSGDYQIITPGSYVICAVTGKKIKLDDLRYWSFQRQEAYINCQVSYEREQECNPELRAIVDRGNNQGNHPQQD